MSEKRFRWDWREQPPMDAIANAVAEMTGDQVLMAMPETGRDDYELVISAAAQPAPAVTAGDAAPDEVPAGGAIIARTGCDGGVLVLALGPDVPVDRATTMAQNLHEQSGLKVIAVADIAAVRAWHPHDEPAYAQLRQSLASQVAENARQGRALADIRDIATDTGLTPKSRLEAIIAYLTPKDGAE